MAHSPKLKSRMGGSAASQPADEGGDVPGPASSAPPADTARASVVRTVQLRPHDGPAPLGVPPWRRRLVFVLMLFGLPIVTLVVLLRIPVARGHLVALSWPFLSQTLREQELEALGPNLDSRTRGALERARLPVYLAVLAESLHAPDAAGRPLLGRALVRLRLLGATARPAAPLLVHLLNRRYMRDYGHDIIETLVKVENDDVWIAEQLEPIVTNPDHATTFATEDGTGHSRGYRRLPEGETRAEPAAWRRWHRIKAELIPRLAARLEDSTRPGRSAATLTRYLARDNEACLFGCGDLWESHRMLGLDESLMSLGRVDEHLKPFDLELVAASASTRLVAILRGEPVSDPITRQTHLLVRCLGYRCDESVTPVLLEVLAEAPSGRRGRLITTLGYLGDQARDSGRAVLEDIWRDESQPMAERFLAVEALARLGISSPRVLEWLAELPFDRVVFKDMRPKQVQRRVFRAYVRLEANRARMEARAR